VVSFTVFYEWGFGMPPHRFLCSLLRCYCLELHYLTPSGVLHIVAFMTLCEAYYGIDPELDMWKYFFRIRCPQDPKAELTISRGAVIRVKVGHGGDPYLEIPMPRSMKEWRKIWFYLKNDNFAPLPAFSSGCPIPLPSWGEGATEKDLCKWRTRLWAYPGSSCPDSPTSEELIAVEVEAGIHIVLDLSVMHTHDAGPIPLGSGIASIRDSTLGPISTAFVILSFHCARDLLLGLRGGCGESRDADLPTDAIGQETRYTSNWATQSREERERDRHATSRAAKKIGHRSPC
jgi:hypothetical protein